MDDYSWPKVKYLLLMKDFDTSNDSSYLGIISGLTELCIAHLPYRDNSPYISLHSTETKGLIQSFDDTLSTIHL